MTERKAIHPRHDKTAPKVSDEIARYREAQERVRQRKPIRIPVKAQPEEHHETQRLLSLVEKHKREREEVE